MLDSGAAGNYIDPSLAQRWSLPTSKIAQPIIILNADGTTNDAGKATHKAILDIVIDDKRMKIEPKIIGLGSARIILGMPWLVKYNPEVDWSRRIMKWREADSQLNQLIESMDDELEFDEETEFLNNIFMQPEDFEEINFKSNASQAITQKYGEKKETDPLKIVPEEFHEFLDIFSEKAASRFPPS